MPWDLNPPPESDAKDRDVSIASEALLGKRICLLICGSIAAYQAPDIIRSLRKQSAEVQAVASESALQFVTAMALEWTSGNPVITCLSADAEHLGGDKEFDIYLVAPASYNTINKCSAGIADSAVSVTLSSAIGQLESGKCKIFMIPCMHGSMHNSILTQSMKKLQSLGVEFIKPRQEDGKNKLPAPEMIAKELIQLITSK